MYKFFSYSCENQLGFHMYKFFSYSCENQLGFLMYKFFSYSCENQLGFHMSLSGLARAATATPARSLGPRL
jgi:hypothetical protein